MTRPGIRCAKPADRTVTTRTLSQQLDTPGRHLAKALGELDSLLLAMVLQQRAAAPSRFPPDHRGSARRRPGLAAAPPDADRARGDDCEGTRKLLTVRG